MTLSCTDRSVTFVNPSPNDWRTLGNHFATDRRLVGDKAPIDHRLIADQSQIGRRYIAKIPALFVVKTIAAPTETDLRLTEDLFETSRRPMKHLSDHISRGQSFVHAQKTARDQCGPATDRRPFGDFNKTFPRSLRPLCDRHFFWSQSDRTSQSQAMCDRGLNSLLRENRKSIPNCFNGKKLLKNVTLELLHFILVS